jgi:hypothetical protein
MRRSVQVAAPLLATAALALMTACRKPEMQRCVDENNRVVADNLCANQPPLANQYPMGYRAPYRYYYGGGGGYILGSIVSGGSMSPSSGHSYATSSGSVGSGTARGGFGSSHFGGSHGGGGGE